MFFCCRASTIDATLNSSIDIAISSKMLNASQIVNYAAVAKLTRGQAVDIIYSAVKNGVLEDGGKKLIDKLVESGITPTSAAIAFGYAVPAPRPTPTPVPVNAPLAVTSVSALNCKQVQVVFNREVNPDSILSAYFEIKDEGTTVKAATPELQADKKTVLLTLDGAGALKNTYSASVLVKKSIRDTSGANLGSDFLKTDVRVQDLKVPELLTVAAVGSKSILLTYDEPVWGGTLTAIATSNYTVGNGMYSSLALSATANPAKSTVLLSLGMPLSPGTVTVKSSAAGMVTGAPMDFAGYKALPKEVSFTYAPDTSAVSASLQSVNRVTRKVVVKFSKPVYGNNVRLYQLVSGVDAYGSNVLSKSEGMASDTWEFTMNNGVPTGSVNFFLVNSATISDQLSDLFGQKVPNLNFSFSVIADNTPPAVASLTVNGNGSFDVVFNEEVDPTEANKIANFEVRNAANVKQNITGATLQVDQQTVRVNVALTDLQTYTFKVLSMKDIAGNLLTVPYSVTRAVSDNANPKVVSAYSVTAERKIFITFSEPMNATELGDRSNYVVDKNGGTDNFQSLTDSDTLSVLDARHVLLTMGAAISTPSVKMSAMRDLSGKKLGSDALFEYTGESGNLLNIGVETVRLEEVRVVGTNLVQLVFNTRIMLVGASDFLFRDDASGAALTLPISVLGTVAYSEGITGNSEIVVQVDRTLNANATYTDNGIVKNLEVQVQPVGTYSASNALVTARNHADALTLVDKVGGAIAKDSSGNDIITWNDYNGDLKIDTVVVKYDEPVLESTLSTLTYTVLGYSVTGVSTDSDGYVTAGTAGNHAAGAQFVIINITKSGQTNDVGSKPTVTQISPISDVLGNIIE